MPSIDDSPAGRAPRARPTAVYPFALAVYPALSLAVSNRGENVRLSDVVLPVGISLWLALVVWFGARLLSKEQHRRGLITLLVVGWFLCYGLLTRMIATIAPGSWVGLDQYALPLSLVLLFLICRATLRTKGNLEVVTRYLNTVSLVLFVLLAITYLSASRKPSIAWEPGVPNAEPLSHPTSDLPDIYYIVLDAYTGGASLAKNYGFDNSEFESALRSRGFYVPRKSRSNYVSTFLALAAALNWEYLDWLPNRLGSNSRDRTLPYQMIEDSRTTRFLKTLGYHVVFFPTAYGATARNRYADQVIPDGAAGQPQVQAEFQSAWLASTVLKPLLQLGCVVSGCAANPLPFRPEPPELVLWKLERLAELPRSSPGPKFVFAHLLVPHEPYVFTASCAPKPLYWPADIDPAEDEGLRASYVEQVQCVNRRVLLLVDRLLRDSARPPVILLQADHGNGRFPYGRPPSLEDISAEQLVDRTEIFAAYYAPAALPGLYDSISPINVIPAVLRAYFRAPIAPLEDRTYYSSWHLPYRFTRIPSR
jgi:hypothetical protein